MILINLEYYYMCLGGMTMYLRFDKIIPKVCLNQVWAFLDFRYLSLNFSNKMKWGNIILP